VGDEPQEASAIEIAREFERAVWSCDRVLVERRNALGEMDVHVFQGHHARLVLPIKQKEAKRCAECDCELGGTDCNWIKSKEAK